MESVELKDAEIGEGEDFKAVSFDEVMTRIYMATGTTTQVDLGEYLGVRQSSVSDAKKRNSIPSRWLLTLFFKDWINPNWILRGIGGMFVAPVMAQPSYPPIAEQVGVYNRIDAFSTEELVGEVLRRTLMKMGDIPLKEDVPVE